MGEKRLIVAVDPGTEKVGVAILEQDLDTKQMPVLLEHELIHAQGDRPFRLFWIHERLTELVAKYRKKYRRIDFAIEKMFMGDNPATCIILGEARGVVLAAAGSVPKARIFDYFPAQHKKSVGGHGGATKYQVMLAVRVMLGISEELPLDVSDACSIGIHHAMFG